MCAPLSFPKGKIATRDPLPTNNSLVNNNRRLWLGIKCSISEPLPMLKTTALSPTKALKAVSSRRAVYSWQCSCPQPTKLPMTLFLWTKRFKTRSNSRTASKSTCPECYDFRSADVLLLLGQVETRRQSVPSIVPV